MRARNVDKMDAIGASDPFLVIHRISATGKPVETLVLLCLSVTALVRWEVERLREEAENSIRLDNVMETE